jgi:hypothetical protein
MTEVYIVFANGIHRPVPVCVFARQEDAIAWIHGTNDPNEYWAEPSGFIPASE